jgi:hypothetical protein
MIGHSATGQKHFLIVPDKLLGRVDHSEKEGAGNDAIASVVN